MQAPAMAAPVATYAGFWKRFVAHLIDQLVLGVAQMIFIVPIFLIMGAGIGFGSMDREFSDAEQGMAAALIVLPIILAVIISVVGSWIYYALMESSSNQATLGKMALGIQVTDMEGKRITFGRATGRHFAKIISSLTLAIGYIMAGFTQQKQALHDIIASTLVVNKQV